ncbi:hypothetical protein GCM10025771_33310 [Niveibacterium umoris]|uniref:diguanylate cyclase n=1 Tax=Niveibacterium umoris TaxID=1193620 RepID=A0A840BKR5_9RHOO|nr:GGDEF domain-containing protein [Niveibacterium umoris]MBB4011476.1 diguanylate cyclase (GGDEF)-like protein [Niveibacterium umoris]
MRDVDEAWHLLLRDPQQAHELAQAITRAGHAAGDQHQILCGEMLELSIRARMANEPEAFIAEAVRIREALSQQGDPRNALRLVVVEANALADLEQRVEALALIDRMLPEARRWLDAADLGRLLNSGGAIRVDEGLHAEAVTAWYEALELLQGIPPTPVLCMVTLNVGVMYMRFGNFAAAEPHLREALRLVEEQSVTGMTNICAGNLAYDLIQLGRAEEASRFLEALAPHVERDYDLREYAYFQIVRSEACSALGQLAAARRCLDEVESFGGEGIDSQNQLYYRIALLRLLRREGRFDEALATLRRAETDPLHIDDPLYELQILLEASELMHALGDDRSAFRYARQHHDYSIEMDREFQRADFLSLHTRYEVRKAIIDRDFEVRRRKEADLARAEIEALNAALEARVQEIERLQEALRDQAIRDPLTGLYNRRFLQELLPTMVARCNREERQVVLCLVDADHFKRVNDTHGHGVGDAVLQALAEVLRPLESDGVVVARFGGEEFAIAFPDCALDQAIERLDTLRTRFAGLQQTAQDGTHFAVSFSAGVAEMPVGLDPAAAGIDAWFALADEALYCAKASGRNRVVGKRAVRVAQ